MWQAAYLIQDKVVSTDFLSARRFDCSWRKERGQVYLLEDVVGWLHPLRPADFAGKSVLELGCGSGGLLEHVVKWQSKKLVGVELGDSGELAKDRLIDSGGAFIWCIIRQDLTSFKSDGFDVVYCVGVLHHLQNPEAGFRSVVDNTRPGGRFHCWVYGREGNEFVIKFVEPLRKTLRSMPFFIVDAFAVALTPFFYALMHLCSLSAELPLNEYAQWICRHRYRFFYHVVLDQLVSPQTKFFTKQEVINLVNSQRDKIDVNSVYVFQRNGNGWLFGGVRK